jgi:hypothetical protein
VNLQVSTKKVERLDAQVGLHCTKQAEFGSYMHEWSLTKGKGEKAPGQVYYWNSKLSCEIEAEVDLHLQHLFLEGDFTNDGNNFPTISYVGDGFSNPLA